MIIHPDSHSAQMLLKLEKCIPHVTLETVPKYANIERPTSSQLYTSHPNGHRQHLNWSALNERRKHSLCNWNNLPFEMLIIDLLSVRGSCVRIDLLLLMSDGQGHLIRLCVCVHVSILCVCLRLSLPPCWIFHNRVKAKQSMLKLTPAPQHALHTNKPCGCCVTVWVGTILF